MHSLEFCVAVSFEWYRSKHMYMYYKKGFSFCLLWARQMNLFVIDWEMRKFYLEWISTHSVPELLQQNFYQWLICVLEAVWFFLMWIGYSRTLLYINEDDLTIAVWTTCIYTSFMLFVRSQGQERFRVIPGGQRSNLIIVSHLIWWIVILKWKPQSAWTSCVIYKGLCQEFLKCFTLIYIYTFLQ